MKPFVALFTLLLHNVAKRSIWEPVFPLSEVQSWKITNAWNPSPMCSPCPLNSSLWTPPPPPPPPPSPFRLWRRYLWYGYGYFVQPLNSSLGRLVISAFYPRSVLVTSMSYESSLLGHGFMTLYWKIMPYNTCYKHQVNMENFHHNRFCKQ